MEGYEILDRLIAEEPDTDAAWSDFLDQYSRFILKIVWLNEHDYDQAMEKYLYVCTRLCRNNFSIFRSFRKDYGQNPPSFNSWLAVVVRNLCVDAHRKQHGRKRYPKLLQSMSAVHRTFFKLYFWKGLSLQEIDGHLTAEPNKGQSAAAILRDIETVYIEGHQRLPQRKQTHRFQKFNDEIEYRFQNSDPAFNKDLKDFFEHWINHLPARQQMALKLRFWNNVAPLSIAEMFNLEPPGKIYGILKQGLSQLREYILEENS